MTEMSKVADATFIGGFYLGEMDRVYFSNNYRYEIYFCKRFNERNKMVIHMSTRHLSKINETKDRIFVGTSPSGDIKNRLSYILRNGIELNRSNLKSKLESI